MAEILSDACNKLSAEFEINSDRMKDLVHPLSDRQINWRPHYDRWSVLDNLQHINTTNKSYLKNIKEQLEKLHRQVTQIEQKAYWSPLGRFVLYLMEPPYRLRFKAPNKLLPAEPLSREDTVQNFSKLHEEIIILLKEAPFYLLDKIRFYSPGSRHFSWSFIEILSIIAAHERRHLWQAEQIVSLTQFPQE